MTTPKEEEIREEFGKQFGYPLEKPRTIQLVTEDSMVLSEKEVLDFILKIRREAIAEERERTLTKISQYRCHPDEIHCTCMDALKDWLENGDE